MNHIALAISLYVTFFIGGALLTLITTAIIGIPFFLELFLPKIRKAVTIYAVVLIVFLFCTVADQWNKSPFGWNIVCFLLAISLISSAALVRSRRRGKYRQMLLWPALSIMVLCGYYAISVSIASTFSVGLSLMNLGLIIPTLLSLFAGLIFMLIESKKRAVQINGAFSFIEPLVALGGILLWGGSFTFDEEAPGTTISSEGLKNLEVSNILTHYDNDLSSVIVETTFRETKKGQKLHLGHDDTLFISLFDTDTLEQYLLTEKSKYFQTPFRIKNRDIDSITIRAIHKKKVLFHNSVIWPGRIVSPAENSLFSLPADTVTIAMDWNFYPSNNYFLEGGRIKYYGYSMSADKFQLFHVTRNVAYRDAIPVNDTIPMDLLINWKVETSSFIHVDPKISPTSSISGEIKIRHPLFFYAPIPEKEVL